MPKSMLTAGMLPDDAIALDDRAWAVARHELGEDAPPAELSALVSGYKEAAHGRGIPNEPTKERRSAAVIGHVLGLQRENPERRKAVHT